MIPESYKNNYLLSSKKFIKKLIFNYRRFHFITCLLMITSFGCRNETSSEDSLSTFEIAPGFKIELLVAEPLIGDPVDMEIDEYGRLYIVEMPGYPLDKSGSGKITLLTDSDADGRIDKSTVFAEGLMLPNSIMRWKKGVLVTDAPNVLYLEDADGDGRAEVRDTLLTGFALSNPQHNLNSPVLGIDNWIYLGHEGAVTTERYKNQFGDPGREVHYPRYPEGPRLGVNSDGRSVRFRPDLKKLELISSHTQFGHTFDERGNHFLVGNANHIYQEMIAEPYLRRNRDLLLSDATQSLSDHGDAAEVFPITQNPEHQLLTDVGVITSACGLTTYLGGAFPPPFDNNVTFVAEPVSNLVHVDKLKENGASFIASRIFPSGEFLASTDAKFRPVNLYVGPDGSLYVVDYYRKIIEHPEWMGEEVIKSGELYSDKDKGRIYRISPTDAKAADWIKGLKLGDAPLDTLVKMLDHPNHWWRQNAQRLIIDRADKKAVALLVQMAADQSSPMGRLHALWTLEGLGDLKPGHIQRALKDPVAGIRENAIKLGELHLEEAPQLVKDLLPLENDSNAKVRFQLLCTLGFIDTPEAAEVRHKLLFKDINDKWVQIAALSASSSQTSSLLNAVLDRYTNDTPAYASLVERLAMMVAASGKAPAIHQLIEKATAIKPSTTGDWQGPVLEGLAQGLEDKMSKAFVAEADQNRIIEVFFEHPLIQVRRASLQLLKVTGIKNETQSKKAIGKAVVLASDQTQPDDKRAAAIDFISLRNPAPYVSLLKKLFVPQEELSVQLAALRTLSAIPDTTISTFLLQRWSVLTPEIHDASIKTFLSSQDRTAMLLNAIESGKIQATSVSWPRKVGLMQNDDEKLRNKARSLFTKNDDAEITKRYKDALTLKGDAIKGKEVFQQNCAICHQIRGTMGVTLGPDLGTIHNWSAEAIMANTLAPNLSLSSGYDLWRVELLTGESVDGIIASETPGAITLRNAGSFEKTISRQNIKSLKTLNMSIMPEGLESKITPQQMADLLAFLRQNK